MPIIKNCSKIKKILKKALRSKNLNINQFEIFLMVVRLKSFSKAAKLLYMTQPAISNHIAAMENYYGTKLFNRHSHGVSLTKAGEVAFEYVQKILNLHDLMEKEIDQVMGKENQKLVVGASSNVGNYALPCSILAFKEKYEEVEISLKIANSTTIVQQVLEGNVDLGVMEGPVVHEDLKTIDVFSDRLVLIVPPVEKWLAKEEISLEEIRKEPLIMREKGSGIRKIWEQLLLETGYELQNFRVVTEMGSIDAIKSSVESGLGVSILSRLSAMKELRRGTLKELQISGISSIIKFQVIIRSDRDQPSLATRFIRFLNLPDERSFC